MTDNPLNAQQLQAIRNEASAALQAAVDKMQLRKWAVEQALMITTSLNAAIERPTPRPSPARCQDSQSTTLWPWPRPSTISYPKPRSSKWTSANDHHRRPHHRRYCSRYSPVGHCGGRLFQTFKPSGKKRPAR